MLGAREFALMRPTAFFITTCRGFIHDAAALADALRRKRIAGARLDVWAQEPPSPDRPLQQFDNVLVSPHAAGITKAARANIRRISALQLDGRRPARLVNAEARPRCAARFERAFGFAPGRG
jgi:D-3-phosphoglycerate dehydrogenase